MSRFTFAASRWGVVVSAVVSVSVAGLLTTACQSDAIICPADLRFTRTPADTVIDVGQQFRAQVTLLGCGGTKTLTDTITWTSSDAAVATVNVTTGVVTGQKAGLASIVPDGRTYHGIFPIQVRVR